MELEVNSPLLDFLKRYRNNPTLFVREVLGATPQEWQSEFLEAISRGERRISIRSGHGVGKSCATAWAAIWFLLNRFPQKTVITAPTAPQLEDALFAELIGWLRRMPDTLQGLISITKNRVELSASPTESFISLRTSRIEQPEALQGVHSDNVMLIADEASGIPEPVFEAASGSMSGKTAVTILLGNPTRSTGYFYDTHTKLSHAWWTRRVSCMDSTRVDEEYIKEQGIIYGEESNAYRIRVLGEFPLGDDDTVIPLHLIESAQYRDISLTTGQRPVWGLDVARFGSDRSALCKRYGNVVAENIIWWRGLDTMQTVGRIKALYDECEFKDRPSEILVDVIGIGAGVVDRARELNLPVRGINVAESPALGEKYINQRAELWYKAKAWLEQRTCKLPMDDLLKSELSTVRYSFTSSGKIKIESKEDIKKRGVSSPDIADAFILTFASDAVIASDSTPYATSWKTPLRRNVNMLA